MHSRDSPMKGTSISFTVLGQSVFLILSITGYIESTFMFVDTVSLSAQLKASATSTSSSLVLPTLQYKMPPK